MARVPEPSHSFSGVYLVMAGSRMIERGIIIGWLKICFSLRRASVTSVPELYSPPDNVLGIAIMRTLGLRNPPKRRSGVVSNPSRPSSWKISCSMHIRTIFAASTTEPPPTATTRSAPACLASRAVRTTTSRVVCCGMPSNVPAYRSPSDVRSFSISSVLVLSVRLAIRKTPRASRRSASSRSASAAGLP